MTINDKRMRQRLHVLYSQALNDAMFLLGNDNPANVGVESKRLAVARNVLRQVWANRDNANDKANEVSR